MGLKKVISKPSTIALSGSDFSLLQHPVNGIATFIRQATVWGISIDAIANNKLKDQPENTSGVTVESTGLQTVINVLQATGSIGLIYGSVGKICTDSKRISDPSIRIKYILSHCLNLSVGILDVFSAATNQASILLDPENDADTIADLKNITKAAVAISVVAFTLKMAQNAFRDIYDECHEESISPSDTRSHFRRRIDAAASSLFTGYDATVALTLFGAFTAPEAIIPLLITDIVAQSLNLSSINAVQDTVQSAGRQISDLGQAIWDGTIGRCCTRRPVLPVTKARSRESLLPEAA
jgi:hypothetical protein